MKQGDDNSRSHYFTNGRKPRVLLQELWPPHEESQSHEPSPLGWANGLSAEKASAGWGPEGRPTERLCSIVSEERPIRSWVRFVEPWALAWAKGMVSSSVARKFPSWEHTSKIRIWPTSEKNFGVVTQ